MKRIWMLIFLLLLLAACGGGAAGEATAVTSPTPATNPTRETTVGATAVAVTAPTLVIPTVDPNAPTFYVATDGSDETGNGTTAAPWATITHALDSVADGSVILVRPGLYTGRVRIRGQFATGVTVRSEVPYQAQLRADETVLTIFEAQGITLEGFDVAHISPAAEALVVQIQDGLGNEPGGAEFTSRIILRNNILHDSYNNDILKINNGVQQIAIIGNVFYNQGDSDEHIDINSARDVVIEDNIFFNDFAASGRVSSGESSSFIVVKDSNGEDDGLVGMEGLTIRRNIFLHYEGSGGQYMVLLGEDGNPYYEVSNALIENNLFLGDGTAVRAPFGTKGVQDVVFRHNTIVGDMPGGAFAWRSNVEGENQPNNNITLVNNIFSDPIGTMDNFATAPAGETAVYTLAHNLYWNGGAPLPVGEGEMVQISADAAAIGGDPRLNPPLNLPRPMWDPAAAQFGGGAADIRTAFRQLVLAYGVPQAGSAAIDAADAAQMSGEDILGQPRHNPADLGAYEVQGDEAVIVLPTAVPAPPADDQETGSETAVSQTLPTLPIPANGGWVTFAIRQENGERIYRLAVAPNATPQDITAVLDAAVPGQYSEWLNISPDGRWYIFSTDRFDPECNGWPCLVITQDFVTFEVVKSGGTAVHAEFSAIGSGGDLIVYKAGDGTHGRDLWAIRRAGGIWSAPLELTTASPFNEHHSPGLSGDGTAVVFACGDDPYTASAICEAATDGSSFAVRFRAADVGDAPLFHPRYAPDGSILFEASWQGEQIWRLPPGRDTPTPVSGQTNDNSPCVLPGGQIVSLWLQREGNTNGWHELKLMAADGGQYTMLLTGWDLFDIGLGCGGE